MSTRSHVGRVVRSSCWNPPPPLEGREGGVVARGEGMSAASDMSDCVHAAGEKYSHMY